MSAAPPALLDRLNAGEFVAADEFPSDWSAVQARDFAAALNADALTQLVSAGPLAPALSDAIQTAFIEHSTEGSREERLAYLFGVAPTPAKAYVLQASDDAISEILAAQTTFDAVARMLSHLARAGRPAPAIPAGIGHDLAAAARGDAGPLPALDASLEREALDAFDCSTEERADPVRRAELWFEQLAPALRPHARAALVRIASRQNPKHGFDRPDEDLADEVLRIIDQPPSPKTGARATGDRP